MIAIPVNEAKGFQATICEHFGHAPYFALVQVSEGKIGEVTNLANPFSQHGPGEIPEFLQRNGVDVIIARGMGQRAQQYFQRMGIQFVVGAAGTVESLVKDYLQNQLQSREYTPPDRESFHRSHES
ncbi:MAG TPA: NifB/NifX family molybdenum-iron cluster-binding protein [Thermotogota bacterium]|nr:NifB/NifX family molybdenum-iron cluster-binding protein [Thermotogota bacterium]HRW91741.1 NifB/NifX family molybdenum-iron cluster-binding protein [Thermotogota bacterium]